MGRRAALDSAFTAAIGALSLLLTLLAGAPATAAEVDTPRALGPKPPERVRRIVTLAPSLTQVVVALGAKDRLVGVSRFDELPEVAALPRVGGFVDPSVEAVLALKPDLLLVQPAPGNQRPVEKLAELGVPVLALPLHTVAQTYASMRAVGLALGLDEQAKAQVAAIEETRTRVRREAKARTRPRVLFVYQWQPLVVAGPGTFAHELLQDAGGVNAAERAKTAYPVYPAEAAVAARPDVIIDAAHDAAGSERLRRIPALARARWVKMPNQDLMHPGPHLGRALETLFAIIHGEASDAGR